MAIQIDYFLAASDEEAAATVEMESGPRSEWADVVPSSNVDPGLALGYLAGVLTQTRLEDFLDEQGPSFVAADESDTRLVLELDAAFVQQLAKVEGPYDEIARQWADVTAPPEADPWEPRLRDLVEFLDALCRMARESVETGRSIYCWLWP